jgi:hypothetical protein
MENSPYICTVLIKNSEGISIASLPTSDFPLEIEIWTTSGPQKYLVNLHYSKDTNEVKSATMTK